MMNEDLILGILKEIRNDQKIMMDKLNNVTNELGIIKNGYTPHEVVELLHFVDELKKKEESRNDTIRKAVINWATPILLSILFFGILNYYK